MPVEFTSRVVAPEDVLFKQILDEAVLLSLSREHYFGLDVVGTRMWTLLTSSRTIQDAYDVLLDEYDVEPARLRVDLEEFVGRLADAGLVRIESVE